MVALIVLAVLVLGMGALIWWGGSFSPTRPRPDSRYRGSTYTAVHRRLERRGDRSSRGDPPASRR